MVNTKEYISEWPIYFNTWLGFLNSQENNICVAHKILVLFYYDMCRLHIYVIQKFSNITEKYKILKSHKYFSKEHLWMPNKEMKRFWWQNKAKKVFCPYEEILFNHKNEWRYYCMLNLEYNVSKPWKYKLSKRIKAKKPRIL